MNAEKQTPNVQRLQARKPFRESKALQQFAGCTMVSGREEFQAAALRTKDEANVQPSATLEIISSKPANA